MAKQEIKIDIQISVPFPNSLDNPLGMGTTLLEGLEKITDAFNDALKRNDES